MLRSHNFGVLDLGLTALGMESDPNHDCEKAESIPIECLFDLLLVVAPSNDPTASEKAHDKHEVAHNEQRPALRNHACCWNSHAPSRADHNVSAMARDPVLLHHIVNEGEKSSSERIVRWMIEKNPCPCPRALLRVTTMVCRSA